MLTRTHHQKKGQLIRVAMNETQSMRWRSRSESLETRTASTKPQVCEVRRVSKPSGCLEKAPEITKYGTFAWSEVYASVKVPHGEGAMQGLDIVESGGLRARVPSQPPSCQKAQKGCKKGQIVCRGDFAGEFFCETPKFLHDSNRVGGSSCLHQWPYRRLWRC
jgi:hypothetical protein